ncbi:MAG: thioredoxin domain-containing protein [Patescibacteria group bacterium]
MKKFMKKMLSRKNFTRIILPIILVIILAIIALVSFRSPEKTINKSEAGARAEKFINDFLMESGTKATVKEITEEYGLYKMQIDIVSDVVESYLSKDGKLFFPQALDIDEINKTQAAAGEAAAGGEGATVSVKNDKPVVELFIMSYCPYGTQIQKGILPVLETLGEKIDFELKFVDYAMHSKEELDENLTQYCIQKNEAEKLNDYLTCFLAEGQSASCISEAGIKKSALDSCISATDKQYKITENFNNKVGYQGNYPGFDVNKADNEKYGVAGSPTLIINGQEIRSNRDSASLLLTICDAFNNPPAECATTLSPASPTPGFGFDTTTNTVAASCE